MVERIAFAIVFFTILLVPCVILALRWRHYRAMEPNQRIAMTLLSSSYVLALMLSFLTSAYSTARDATILTNLGILTLGCVFFAAQRKHWRGFLVACLSVWGTWVMQLIANSVA